MRKLLSLCVILTFLLMGCALSKSLITQNFGFLLAQQEPKLAQEILGLSRTVLDKASGDFTEVSFQIWATSVIERLEVHPLLKMNFEEMLKLVNVKIELADNQQEIAQLARAMIQNFVKGIDAAK